MIQRELLGDCAVIRLARPEAMNALNVELVEAVLDAFRDIVAQGSARAVLITGSGRAFSAGGDLSHFARTRSTHGENAARRIGEFMEAGGNALVEAIVGSPLPVVCAVNGPCVGGAVGIALAADMVLAARSAYFLIPQVEQLGVVPDFGATWVLARHLGRARALGLALLGERLGAERAEQWGLIWRCVDDERLEAEAIALVQRLARLPAAAIGATRALLDSATGSDCTTQLARERKVQMQMLDSDHPWQAFARFAAKART